jgi:gamma-glutamylcyclotransferase (GGCT)/AIG2-like uncharacterized protein YtfP
MTDNNYNPVAFETEMQEYLALEAERDRIAKAESKSGTIDGHFVFVYGSLKMDHGNHDMLRQGNGVFIGEAVTSEAEFDMRSMTAFPAVYRGGKHQIAGEVYAVDNNCLRSLDRLEGNGHFYTRAEVKVRVYNRFGLGMIDFEVPAWIYLVPASFAEDEPSVGKADEQESRVLNWKR